MNLMEISMPFPNSITQVINKKGEVVSFDLSRIHNAISNAIYDIENVSSWESKTRGLKYAELVEKRIHRNFYNLNHLVTFFSKMILSFDANEREERIYRQEFGKRLACLFYLEFMHHYTNDSIGASEKIEVKSFIKQYFEKIIENTEVLNQTSNAFLEKVYQKQNQGITKYDQFPEREFMQNTIEQVLKEIGEVEIAEGFMLYREGRLKIKSKEITEAQFTHDGIHRDRIRNTLLWNIENQCDSVFSLNDWIVGKNGCNFKELVELSDKRFYNDIRHTVDKILDRADEIKVVVIAGPSCSNKTTTTAIIEQELAKSGLRLKQLNVDDYFFNLSEHPKDEFGDYDFEMPEAIDMKLLNENLRDLVRGKKIQKPIYNFKTGQRDNSVEFEVQKDEIILIDCLHGLFKPLTESVPANKKFKIYTESSNMIRSIDGAYTKWTDMRLAKRMIRDLLYRNYDVSRTLGHWGYVRKGELKHIIPYIYSVDSVLNSGLAYELPILKSILYDKLPNHDYLKSLRLDGRLDAYSRGIRLRTLFDSVIAYDNFDNIPSTSPIREFIGGSSYTIAHNE